MEENAIKKVMPHNLEAEKSIISSILIDQEALYAAMELVTPDDFYNAAYGKMYESMIELNKEGKNIDLITFQEKIKSKELPENMTSFEVIDEIMDFSAVSVNVRQHAQIVKDKSILRKLIKTNEQINKECYTGKGDIEGIINTAEKMVFNLVQSRGGGDMCRLNR